MSVVLFVVLDSTAAVAPTAILGEERHGLCRRVRVGTLSDRSLEREGFRALGRQEGNGHIDLQ